MLLQAVPYLYNLKQTFGSVCLNLQAETQSNAFLQLTSLLLARLFLYLFLSENVWRIRTSTRSIWVWCALAEISPISPVCRTYELSVRPGRTRARFLHSIRSGVAIFISTPQFFAALIQSPNVEHRFNPPTSELTGRRESNRQSAWVHASAARVLRFVRTHLRSQPLELVLPDQHSTEP